MLLTERYRDKIRGVISCYDRIIIQGTLPNLCYAQGMSSFLTQRGIRIFDYPRFAEPLRNSLRANATALAQEHGVEIEFVRQSKLQRKEKRIATVISKRGPQPGLVHILSAMERCPSFKPWHDKQTHKTFLKPDDGKCLHYYFYFLDEQLGLIYVRVPTWCPFRLQFYFNGHSLLAAKLKQHGIEHRLLDNAFVEISDWEKAQQLATDLDIARLHQKLDDYAQLCCPVIKELGVNYHWSLMQVEYATDIVFKRQQDLALLYDPLARTAIHAVKPEHIATFLGRKLNDHYRDEMGNRFDTRIEGTCIRHRMGPVSVKLYDKFGLVLRIETTVNDPSFFKHHRWVEQRSGQREFKLAPLKKSIYSLGDLADLLRAANRRYLEFISELDDPSAGRKLLNQVCEPKRQQGRSYKGLNFFHAADQILIETLARGEYLIHGLRNKDLRQHLPQLNTSQISRRLKSLRLHGLIKRVGRTYKYYLSELGRRVILTGLKLKQLFIIPNLAQPATANIS
jgi:hypothetical protein